MLEKVAESLARAAGIQRLDGQTDVHRGKVGYTDCAVSVAIEAWNGAFWVAITVALRRGRSSTTRVMKWPYSRARASDLSAVLADFSALAAGPDGLSLQDPRGAIGRWFDRLVRRGYLGCHELASPIAHTPATRVDVVFEVTGNQSMITLTEHRSSHGFTSSQLPLAAVPAILAALQQCESRLKAVPAG